MKTAFEFDVEEVDLLVGALKYFLKGWKSLGPETTSDIVRMINRLENVYFE